MLLLRNNQPFPYTMKQLLELPEHTLGNELATYLQKKGFSLAPGYVRHDCKHILLGYEMDEEGEACMQFWFFGNRHYSFPVLMTVVLCLFLMPGHWRKFYREFKKGRSSPAFAEIDFNTAVLQNTDQLRTAYSIIKQTV
ncbi:MAG: hypothetical protein JWO44_1311 [Bacteroidetes bacterium]|nr:hypothetical protein [Bacteroidota bacterium]